MKPRPVLGAIVPARELVAALPADGTVARVSGKDIRLSARRCYTGDWLAPNLTGGLNLWAYVRDPEYGGPGRKLTRRLAPGWTTAQAIQAAETLYTKAWRELPRMERAELVWRQSKKIAETPEFFAAVTAEEQKLGRVSDFSEMTESDSAHWLKWLDQWIPKEPTCHRCQRTEKACSEECQTNPCCCTWPA